MHINPRPQVKNKSVVWAMIAFFLFIYNVFDIWSNFEFIGQKSGVVWQTLHFVIATSTGARILAVAAMGAFMFTLLFEVKTDDKGKRLPHKKQGPLTTPDERIIIKVLPEYLTKFYSEHTEPQAGKLVAAFMGKWVNVTGDVTDVSISSKTVVYLNYPSDAEKLVLIFAYFDEEEWGGRIEVLRRGERISVIGRITAVSASTIRLEQCELVDSSTIEDRPTETEAIEEKSRAAAARLEQAAAKSKEAKGVPPDEAKFDSISHRLDELAMQGQTFISRCMAGETGEELRVDYYQWYIRVAKFLRENISEESSEAFLDGENLIAFPNLDKPRKKNFDKQQEYWLTQIYTRWRRLGEIRGNYARGRD